MRVRALAHALAITVLVAAATASAQREPDAAARRAARAEFARGEEAFAASDFTLALERFRRAFELAPHDHVRFNIAVCLERLGRYREAVREYDIAAESAVLGAEARSRAADLAAAARERLGTLVIEGGEEGAAVLVDGEELCRTPCTVAIDPGDHSVRVRGEAGETDHRVQVGRGATATVAIAGATRATGRERVEGPRAEERSRRIATSRRERESGGGPGALTWIGAGLAVAGAAGIVYFGLEANAIHDEYEQRGCADDLCSRGTTMRDLANISIGVAIVGAVLIVVDLLVGD